MNMQVSINLTDIKGAAVVKDGKGNKGVFIPIESGLIDGKKGVYLAINVYEYKNGTDRYGKTHYVKQNIPSDLYAKMSEQERRDLPFIGDGKIYGNTFKKQQQAAPEQGSVTVFATNSDTDELIF